VVGHVRAGRGSVGTKQVHPGEARWGQSQRVASYRASYSSYQWWGLLEHGGAIHYSLGLELTEAVEGDRAALLHRAQRSIPGWAGDRDLAYSFSVLFKSYVNGGDPADRGPRGRMRDTFTCGALRCALSLGVGRGRYGCESRCGCEQPRSVCRIFASELDLEREPPVSVTRELNRGAPTVANLTRGERGNPGRALTPQTRQKQHVSYI
jgi:hypothetical protein